jgi:hypothetical protein
MVTMTIKCITCQQKYPADYVADFENGECLPCSTQRWSEEFDAKIKRELSEYKKRTGHTYDFSTFYYACYDDQVSKSDVEGLEELTSLFLSAIHQRQWDYPPSQLTIEF